MIRLIPDWLLYIIVIAVVVFVLFRVDRRQRADAPEALPDAPETGAFLPPPSHIRSRSAGRSRALSRPAWAARSRSREDGWWLTARHVVDGCERVGLIVSRGAAARVTEVKRRAVRRHRAAEDRQRAGGACDRHVGAPLPDRPARLPCRLPARPAGRSLFAPDRPRNADRARALRH